MSYEKFISGWLVAIRDIEVDFDLETSPLEIKTDSAIGSNEELKVNFLSAQEEVAGGVSILLETAPRYRFHDCMYPEISFSAALPSETTKIWRITLTRSSTEIRVTIHCNNEEVLNVVLSDSVCGYVSDWRTYWEKHVKKIKFPSSFSAADYYRAYEPVAPQGTYLNFT